MFPHGLHDGAVCYNQDYSTWLASSIRFAVHNQLEKRVHEFAMAVFSCPRFYYLRYCTSISTYVYPRARCDEAQLSHGGVGGAKPLGKRTKGKPLQGLSHAHT